VQVDLLGRLGTFGLGIMKTKADRLWDEFGLNLAKRLARGPEAVAEASTMAARTPLPAGNAGVGSAAAKAPLAPSPQERAPSWWRRLFGTAGDVFDGRDAIRVDIQRGDTRVRIQWPTHSVEECAAWLQAYLK